MKNVRIAVAGAMGRMGQAVLRLAAADNHFQIEGALETENHPKLGDNVGLLLNLPDVEVRLTDRPEEALHSAGVLITFTTPEATVAHARACARLKKNIVVGTTGLSEKDRRVLKDVSQKIGVVVSPNMSVGVNLLFVLTELAASKLDPAYDVEITETHHRMKKDAPSGTALKLAELVADKRGEPLAGVAVYGRHGTTGPRPRGKIGIHALRGGDVVGEHLLEFIGTGEKLGLSHRATTRDAFASGALLAARFVAGKRKGLWTMREVLGF